MKHPPTILTCITLLALTSLPVSSATFTWTGGGTDNLFSNPENWGETTLFPGPDDLALFNSSGAITVEFGADQTTEEIRFLGTMDGPLPPNVLFDLGNNTYTVTAGGSTQIMRPSGDNSPRTFRLQNGEVVIGGSNFWGHDGNSGASNNGEVIVRVQDDATLRLTGPNNLGWINNAANTVTARFFVENGGNLHAEHAFSIAGNATGDVLGFLDIVGPDSSFIATGNTDRNVINVGGDQTGGGGTGTGTLTITNGGFLESDRAINVALEPTGIGTLTVSGGHTDVTFTPSLINGDQLYIGGGRSRDRSQDPPAAGGEGLAQFINGGTGNFNTLTVYHNDVADTKGTLSLDAGFVNVSGHATFESGSIFRMTLHGANQPIADHGGLTVSGDLTLDSPFLEVFLGSGFNGQEHDIYEIIKFESDLLGAGTFQGLADGAAFWVGNTPLQINYGSLAGYDEFVTLTVIPEPGAASLMLAGLALILASRRRLPRVA